MVYWGVKPSPGTPLVGDKGVGVAQNWEAATGQPANVVRGKLQWDALNSLQGQPISTTQAQGKLLEMLNDDPAGYKKLTDHMLQLGLLHPGYQFGDVQQVWNQAIQNAATLGPQSMVSPQAALDLMAQGGSAAPGAGGTTGQSTVKQYTAQTVEALVNGAFKTAVGRNATKAERAKFLEYINKQELANPATQSVDGSQQTYTGGLDETQLAQDYANTNAPDVERVQGEQFYNVLKGMVG